MNTHTIAGPGFPLTAAAPLEGPAAESRSIEDPTKPITYEALAELISGGPTASGQSVSERKSLRIPTVWACVQVIARAIARMPLLVYERTDAGRERARSHLLYPVLSMRANPDASAFSVRSAWIANTLLWGAGYAEIVRRGDGRAQALVPIESSRVRPFRVAGDLRYEVTTDTGARVVLLKRDIVHLPGLSLDGISGLSVIAHARQLLGTALSRGEFQGRMYKNGLRPSGVIEHPMKLSPQAIANLRTSIMQLYAGVDNAGKPMILEEGMKWNPATIMPLTDAQFIESSHLEIEDICRLFGVPPHKVQHLLRSTNNNIEQQSLDFLGDTLQPWVEAAEQELNWKLFDEDERERYYCEHLTQSIVQMDANARGTLYQRLFQVGAMSPDDVRERENMNRLPDDRGQQYYVPSNMMPAPTPEQADRLLDAWTKKAAGSGQPAPKTDDKVAGAE